MVASVSRLAPIRPGNPAGAHKGEDGRSLVRRADALLSDLRGAAPEPLPDDGTGTSSPVEGRRLPAIAASRQAPDRETTWSALYGNGAALEPPYDPWALCATVEESGALPFLIDTIATNVSGFGVELVPTFPKRDPDGKEVKPPADAAAERARLQLFVTSCALPFGIEGIMDRVDRDVETIGWGAFEVLRDRAGKVAALESMRGYQLRLGRVSEPILVDQPVYDPESGEQVAVPRWRRFRRVIQIVDGVPTYFREFGDPRPMRRDTGEYGEVGGKPFGRGLDATEVMVFSLYNPRTPYGIPRWVGGSAHARAEREASDLVVSWFLDAPIGAKLAMVAGGAWAKDSMKRATDQIDLMARGRANAWTIIGLEAEVAQGGAFDDGTGPAAPRIALEDLAFTLPVELYAGDGNLIDGSARRLARLFRLPPIYWGASDDYSRAAVNSARATGEEQVMRPIRRLRWESRFNGELLPAMGIRHWRIRLKGANTTDDTEIAGAVGGFVAGGGASPNALITLWNEMTGQEQAPIVEPWGDRPFPLTTALVGAGKDPNLGLDEIAALAEAEKEAQRQAAQDAAEAAGAAGGPGGPGGGKPPGTPGGPPGKVGKREQEATLGTMADLVGELLDFRRTAEKALQDLSPGAWG